MNDALKGGSPLPHGLEILVVEWPGEGAVVLGHLTEYPDEPLEAAIFAKELTDLAIVCDEVSEIVEGDYEWQWHCTVESCKDSCRGRSTSGKGKAGNCSSQRGHTQGNLLTRVWCRLFPRWYRTGTQQDRLHLESSCLRSPPSSNPRLHRMLLVTHLCAHTSPLRWSLPLDC